MSQASWKDQIKKKWGPHSHCPICGKAMQSDKQFCSQTCKDNYISREKKQKKKGRIQMIILFGMMGAMFILMMFLGQPA
jgi:predicted nucleic acid-binding Zn ribbon protein